MDLANNISNMSEPISLLLSTVQSSYQNISENIRLNNLHLKYWPFFLHSFYNLFDDVKLYIKIEYWDHFFHIIGKRRKMRFEWRNQHLLWLCEHFHYSRNVRELEFNLLLSAECYTYYVAECVLKYLSKDLHIKTKNIFFIYLNFKTVSRKVENWSLLLLRTWFH